MAGRAVGGGVSALELAVRNSLGPVLALDFLSGALNSRITYSRASTATYWNSSGVLTTAAVDEPRFEYRWTGSAWVPRGLMVEGSLPNLMIQSNNPSLWTITGTGSQSQNVTGPDGVSNSAWTLTDSDAAAARQYLQATVVANNSSNYTVSVFVKKTSGTPATYPRITGSLANGTAVIGHVVLNTTTGAYVAATGDTGNTTVRIQDRGDWWRVNITLSNNTTGNTSLRLIVQPAYNTDGTATAAVATTGSVVIYGGQQHNALFPVSYVPTTAASVTRAASVATITGANFSEWFNPLQGTLVVEAENSAASSLAVAASISDGTANEFIQLATVTTDPKLQVTDGGAAQVDLDAGSITAYTAFKLAGAYEANNFATCVGGGAVATDTGGTLPTPNQLRVGASGAGASFFSGHIRNLSYYNTRLSSTQLQAVTA